MAITCKCGSGHFVLAVQVDEKGDVVTAPATERRYYCVSCATWYTFKDGVPLWHAASEKW